MSKYELYLNEILRAIELIEKSIKGKSFEEFKSNRETIDANSMRLQIIGESISKLPKEIISKYKEITWREFLQTRNIISHAYFAVNAKIVWSILKEDVPKLKDVIQKIKRDIKDDE
ncbi:MAG: HepT-like ribonuclease domain-containing protein [Nanoarchaeota archaeon]